MIAMSVKQLTDEQIAAIEAEGETLVSASAGSGKTFVMIEKIIRLILEGKAEIAGILAVTFTNLAAAEMKEKLKRAVTLRIANEQDAGVRARLKYELNEIGASDICTIHSFCGNLIRRYFYLSDDNADFDIADGADAAEMKARAADLALDELLERGSEGLNLLLKLYAGSKGASRLKELLLPLYEKIKVHADYSERLHKTRNGFTKEQFDGVAAALFEEARLRAEKIVLKAEGLQEEIKPYIERGEMKPKYAEFAAELAEAGKRVCAARSLFDAAKCAGEIDLSNKPSNAALKKAENIGALALDQSLDNVKNALKELVKELGEYGSQEQELSRYLQSGEIAVALGELLLAFDEKYEAIKKRAGKLDFSDLEHRALALLRHPAVQEELREKYTYVFVDEYQDVNPCQESILNLLGGKNKFMVGDVKQSIYGFRGCSAKFFANKFERLSKEGRALVLNGNFRSAPKVLDAVNVIFSEAMTKESGAVDYRNTAMMRASERFPANSGEVWLNVLPEEEKEESAERDVYSVVARLDGEEGKTDPEGRYIAGLIAAELDKKRYDADLGDYVSNDYKDVVVLTRSKTNRAAKIIAELVKCGIPVASTAEYNICDYPEIKRLIEILKYIDCAAQDVPLAAALKSGMCGLTDEELAKIRLYDPAPRTFVAACKNYAERAQDELSEKLKKFYAYAEELRLLATVKSASELLAKILSDTGEEIALLREENGEERVKRVDRFLSEFDGASVSDALRRLKNSEYFIGFSEAGGENAVRVMTMHASKGLEFPVTIVAGMDAPFDARDVREKILYDEEYGFAPQAYDFENFAVYDTLLRVLFGKRMKRKRAEDEMRLLYVAATRAQHTLHFVFKKEGEFDYEKVLCAGKMSDFIPFEKFRDRLVQIEGGTCESGGKRPLLLARTNEAAQREILQKYRRAYPFEECVRLPVKTSASALLKELGEPFYAEKEMFPREGDPVDTETGIAYHAFLERADFAAQPKEEAARVFELLAREQPALAGRLDLAAMEQILAMPVFSSIKGYSLLREQEFLLSLPARELYGAGGEDEVLVQGIIDLLAVRGDRAILIDYKFTDHSAERLKADYARQIALYAAAVKRVVKPETLSAYLVNIKRRFCVEMPVH